MRVSSSRRQTTNLLVDPTEQILSLINDKESIEDYIIYKVLSTDLKMNHHQMKTVAPK